MDHNEFILLAAKKNKLKRAEAARMIRDTAARDDIPRAELDAILAELYRHFLPPATPKQRATDPFTWVASATAHDGGTRPYLEYVYADGRHIVGTDGHRLHAVLDRRKPGLYDVATGARVFDRWEDHDRSKPGLHPGKFPGNWELIITPSAKDRTAPLSAIALDSTERGGAPAYSLHAERIEGTWAVPSKQWEAITCAAGPNAKVYFPTDRLSRQSIIVWLDAFGGASAAVMRYP